MTTEIVQKLRHGNVLNLWNNSEKQFIKIQLNRKEKRICWERHISLDRKNWIKRNAFLSLKDVRAVIQYYININQNNHDTN